MAQSLVSCFRSRACVYRLPTSSDTSAVASGLVRVLLRHDHLIRNRRSGQLQPSLFSPQNSLAVFFCYSNNNLFHHSVQFMGLESLVTSLSDLYPSYARKGYRRELVLLLICAVSYAFGLLLVSQVSYVFIGGHMCHSSFKSYALFSVNTLPLIATFSSFAVCSNC